MDNPLRRLKEIIKDATKEEVVDADVVQDQLTSPLPEQVAVVEQPQEPTLLDFSEAVKELANGQKVTRVAWGNDNLYFQLNGGLLRVHEIDTFKDVVLAAEDFTATDWKVLA